jgi:hypothetical protein
MLNDFWRQHDFEELHGQRGLAKQPFDKGVVSAHAAAPAEGVPA